MIEHLQKLPPETVEQFLSSRDAEALNIPPKLAEYILQLNEAANLLREYKYISECALKLKESYPDLSFSTCKNRIYDAIKYFNDSSNVTAPEWNYFFADVMMKLAYENEKEKQQIIEYNGKPVSIITKNLKEARYCYMEARKYYLEASANAIDPERIRFKHQIVSADMELDRMGVKKQGFLNAYKKALSIIDNTDATDKDKQRMIDEVERELNITDIPHEEIGN